jgi:hypothetical protein
MKKQSTFILLCLSELLLFMASCKKDNPTPDVRTNFATLGLYEVINAGNRRAYIAISQVGNQKINYASIFDTGSTGMTIDAKGLLPASMISASGIQITGDSVNINGITVTSQTAILSYGSSGSGIREYGNLAYAPVTIGDQNGNITTPRIPFFIYYKVVDETSGNLLPAHSNDVFGVGPGTGIANLTIASPLSYFKSVGNITSGFKLNRLNNNAFSTSGTYVSGLLAIGLTLTDLSSSGFIMHPCSYSALYGYSPDIVSTVSYNGQNFTAISLFDTGTPSISILKNNAATNPVIALPANTTITMSTNKGFSYQYITGNTYNRTNVENNSFSNDVRTIFSIDFFINNEFLMDYANHQLGLKNN